MNSIKALWNRRIRFLVKLYYDFIAFQLDMVSLIYIAGMVIFIGYYYYPEVEGYLYWIRQEPWSYLLYFFSVKVASGGKHTGYLKEADELFLTPLNLYGREFVQRSHNLNRILGFVSWGLWVAIMTALGILTLNPLGFLITGLLWRYLGMNGRFFIQQISGKWIQRTVQFFYKLLFISLTFGWIFYWDRGLGEGFFLLAFIITALLWWTDRKKNTADLHWSRMISEETNRRAQRLSAIIQVVPEEKSRGINTSRTLKVFSGVKMLPFSPVGAALLAFERRMRRGKGNLVLLINIALVHWVAMVFIEGTLVQMILNILVFFIIQEFCLSLWNAVLDEDWFHIYPFSSGAIKRGIWIGSFSYVFSYMLLTFLIYYLRWRDFTAAWRFFLVFTVVMYLLNQFRSSNVYYNYRYNKRHPERQLDGVAVSSIKK